MAVAVDAQLGLRQAGGVRQGAQLVGREGRVQARPEEFPLFGGGVARVEGDQLIGALRAVRTEQVADQQRAAGPQHAARLAQEGQRVRQVVQDGVAGDGVEAGVSKRQALGVGPAQGNARRPGGVLREHMDELHILGKGLLEYETLSGAEVRQLLDGGQLDRPDPDDDGASDKARSSVPSSGVAGKKDRPGSGFEPEPQPQG